MREELLVDSLYAQAYVSRTVLTRVVCLHSLKRQFVDQFALVQMVLVVSVGNDYQGVIGGMCLNGAVPRLSLVSMVDIFAEVKANLGHVV